MDVSLDEQRQEKAREYARIRIRLYFVNLGIAALSIVVLLTTGLNVWLRDWLQGLAGQAGFLGFLAWQPVAGWFPLQILLYCLVLGLVYEVISAPLGYYSGYVLPHRFGLSVMTFKGWIADQLKGIALQYVWGGIIISVIYALLAYQPQWWWLWVAVVMLLFSVVLANLAPILIFPLFNKFTPLPEGELTQRLLALAKRANTRVRGVYSMQMSNKTTMTNAALMGLGNTRRIVLGDTMTDRYTTDEIEVVLAHELGHHVHQDIWKSLVLQSVLTLGGLYIANLVLHWIVQTQPAYQGLADPATIPLLLVIGGLYGLVLTPINNAYSRTVEYQADEYALTSTGNVGAFKSAMTRLANQNLSEADPPPIVETLFYSHPSIGKRLKHAEQWGANHSRNIP